MRYSDGPVDGADAAYNPHWPVGTSAADSVLLTRNRFQSKTLQESIIKS